MTRLSDRRAQLVRADVASEFPRNPRDLVDKLFRFDCAQPFGQRRIGIHARAQRVESGRRHGLRFFESEHVPVLSLVAGRNLPPSPFVTQVPAPKAGKMASGLP